MKYLIVSDIHGCKEAASIIKNKFSSLKCDKILILGDILYHGPRNDLPENYHPKSVISILNELSNNIIAIKGNCDAEVDQMVLDFKILDEYSFIHNNKVIYCTHGHHVNHQKPTKYEVDYVLHGHTHVIRKDIVNNVTYVNLGSITLPKENTAKCYAILEKDLKIYDINDNLILSINILGG